MSRTPSYTKGKGGDAPPGNVGRIVYTDVHSGWQVVEISMYTNKVHDERSES